MHSVLTFLSICAYLLILSGEVQAAPQTDTSGPGSSISVDRIQARLKEVEASSEYDETSKNKLLDLYRKTLTSLESARAYKADEQRYSKARESAGKEASKVREQLEEHKQTQKAVDTEFPSDTPLNEVEQNLLKQKADYTAVDAKLSGLEDRLDNETGRPDQARKRLNEARQMLETIGVEAKGPPPADQSPQLTEAMRWHQHAQMQALNAEIAMLDRELLSQPMRVELLKAQRDTTAHNLKRIGERVSLLETQLSSQRRSEVEEAQAKAEEDIGKLADKLPVIQALARKNTSSSDQLASLTEKLEKVVSGDQAINNDAKRIEEEFRRAQQKLEVAGLSQALGQVLVEQRRLLPNIQGIQRTKRQREKEISATALTQIQLNEEIRDLRDLDQYVGTLIAPLTPQDVLGVRTDLRALAESRIDLLTKITKLNDAYLRALAELDYAETRLINAVIQYDTFLAERLLWIRSGPMPNIEMLLNTPAQVIEFLSPVTWLGIFETLLGQLSVSAVPILVIALIIVLLLKQPSMKQSLQASGKKTIKPRSDSYSYTLQALVLTLLIALPWPLLFGLIGWMLSTAPDLNAFSKSLAYSLIIMAPAFFYLNAFRNLCLADGLAETHFRWPEKSTHLLRKQIAILMLVFLPSAVIGITSSHQSQSAEGVLGRIAFIVLMISLSYFFYRLLGPKQPVLQIEFKRHPESKLTRLRYLWLVLALILPLLLVVLAVSGFLYTAATLTGSMIDTLWLALGFLVIHQMAVRWLLMIRRKLDFEATIERRRAALAAAEEQEEETGDTSEQIDIEEPEIDLKALNEDSKKLLNSAIVFGVIIGLWFIWSDVLPAFGRLDNMALWHYEGTIDGEDSQIPITLADMLLSLIIIIITVVASKHFPALLEIVLLKRFSFTSGGRYAATTLSRYGIAAVGTLLALNTIGASWSQVQWLAAALSVGIGFGLQEIVANFISGIIILFERPIRVGDVVTVGDVNGCVTRIQIRATTIRTWDRQELLVPNKEFITGRLLNWSLSDQTTRIKVPVGVAYGSDVTKAMQLMNEVAKRHPLVLEDPAPGIIFDAFADNSLNLELRCFVGAQEDRMPVRTELHEMINDKFNEHGIVIAFPQRDVHLDTSQPLDVRIHRNKE